MRKAVDSSVICFRMFEIVLELPDGLGISVQNTISIVEAFSVSGRICLLSW